MKPKTRIPLKPLQRGQVWQFGDSNLQIELVGKRLVHYKHYKGNLKRSPISLTGIGALEKYLKSQKATLIQEQEQLAVKTRS